MENKNIAYFEYQKAKEQEQLMIQKIHELLLPLISQEKQRVFQEIQQEIDHKIYDSIKSELRDELKRYIRDYISNTELKIKIT